MHACYRGDKAKRESNWILAAEEYESALSLERQAAAMLPVDGDVEPTRGILYRSAGTIALRCAEMLAKAGLEGNPDPRIRLELQEVLDMAVFK